MKFAPIRTALVIILALLGSAAVLAFLVMTTNLLAVHTQSMSDVLPAEDTLLLLAHPEPEDIALFSQWFPVLQEAPIQEGIEGVAVINTPEERQVVVVLLRSNRPLREDSNTISLPPFYARVSDSAAIPVLRNRIGTLSRYSPFHSLRTATISDDTWVYATADSMQPTNETPASAIAQLLMQGVTHVGYVRNSHSTQLHLYGTLKRRSDRITVQPPADMNVNVAISDAKEWLQELSDVLPEERAIMLPALLQKLATTTIGPGVSWTYDLLPLLQDDGLVLVDTNASGALAIALGGNHNSNRDAATLVALMQDSRKQMEPQYEIRERFFDNRFPAKDIRMSPNRQDSTPIKWQGWQIEHSQDSQLFTAQRGRSVVVSTNEPLLKKAIETLETSPNLPSGAATLGTMRTLAAGTFERDQLQKMLQDATGWELGTMPLPLPTPENIVQWKLLQQGNVLILELTM